MARLHSFGQSFSVINKQHSLLLMVRSTGQPPHARFGQCTHDDGGQDGLELSAVEGLVLQDEDGGAKLSEDAGGGDDAQALADTLIVPPQHRRRGASEHVIVLRLFLRLLRCLRLSLCKAAKDCRLLTTHRDSFQFHVLLGSLFSEDGYT